VDGPAESAPPAAPDARSSAAAEQSPGRATEAPANEPLPAPTTQQPSADPPLLSPAPQTTAAQPPATVPAPAQVAGIPLALTVALDPPVAHVGDRLVIDLGITNHLSRTIGGVDISTSGSWETLTVLGIAPNGRLEQDDTGWHIQSATPIRPRETGHVYVTVSPNQEGDQPLTFRARALDSE
jgi:hypothetical protein